MIEQPDVEKAVFVRVLREGREPVVIEGTDTAFELRRGDVFVVRYCAVREGVVAGDVELL